MFTAGAQPVKGCVEPDRARWPFGISPDLNLHTAEVVGLRWSWRGDLAMQFPRIGAARSLNAGWSVAVAA